MRSQVMEAAALLQVPLLKQVELVTEWAYPEGHAIVHTVSSTTSAHVGMTGRHVAPNASLALVHDAAVNVGHSFRQLSLFAANRNPAVHEQAKEPALEYKISGN